MTRCPITNRIRGTLSLFRPVPQPLTRYQLETLARIRDDFRSLPIAAALSLPRPRPSRKHLFPCAD